jgi:exopolysaccharide biosynthesis protein
MVWLVTVDGRNPAVSLGMSFTELQRLSKRLGLRSVMNLDGGGSTTMWVDGRIVNHPSDAGGPRKVSDAILVVPRGR